MSGAALIEARGLCAAYDGRQVLSGIDLAVGAGEWIGVVGPNASGKSTLLRCLSGLLAPSRGRIDRRATIGYACAPELLPALLTGWQCLEVYAAAKSLPIGDDVLELAKRLGFAPHGEQFVATLSLGTRQKLAILLALLGAPGVIVFDEVFNGLDPASALVLKEHLHARVATRATSVLLATHSLDIVSRWCNRMILIGEGRIVRQWDGAALDALREAGALERALADAG